jgi:hypothetical protein
LGVDFGARRVPLTLRLNANTTPCYSTRPTDTFSLAVARLAVAAWLHAHS